MTKKQKEEQRAAELRKQALLASGVQIEGLQQSSTSDQPPRKVVYGNRKKKTADRHESKPTTREQSPVPTDSHSHESVDIISASAEPERVNDVKDNWEASSGDENALSQSNVVKDSWDDESMDETSDTSSPRAQIILYPFSEANGCSLQLQNLYEVLLPSKCSLQDRHPLHR